MFGLITTKIMANCKAQNKNQNMCDSLGKMSHDILSLERDINTLGMKW